MVEMKRYLAGNPEFSAIAEGMEAQWNDGLRQSLGIGGLVAVSLPDETSSPGVAFEQVCPDCSSF